MKKLLFILFASLLVLGACGKKEETTSKEENTKKTESNDKKEETKKEDKIKKKEDKDKESAENSKPKTEEQSTEEVTTEEPQSVEEDTTEEPAQDQPAQDDSFTSGPTGQYPANLNPDESLNTNLNGEHVISPGWTEDEQDTAYQEYLQAKQEQARHGVVPGEGYMDIDE
ncbi:hypothetical protein [Mammaliicoccus lentus]|uniref:hypothetical protein n=1 Tax=Mammaliicoccus lentus TaxID=42858 RepID=UPI001C4F7C40|nr:hypothetical protein [Mammaliicoccus lentus]MBW0761383.1 hypothetical protein [Mammaliicoccus lentus]